MLGSRCFLVRRRLLGCVQRTVLAPPAPAATRVKKGRYSSHGLSGSSLFSEKLAGSCCRNRASSATKQLNELFCEWLQSCSSGVVNNDTALLLDSSRTRILCRFGNWQDKLCQMVFVLIVCYQWSLNVLRFPDLSKLGLKPSCELSACALHDPKQACVFKSLSSLFHAIVVQI